MFNILGTIAFVAAFYLQGIVADDENHKVGEFSILLSIRFFVIFILFINIYICSMIAKKLLLYG